MKILIHRILKLIKLLFTWLKSRFERADIAVFHELQPPPDGGGNQFVRAVARAWEAKGYKVVFNRIPPGTKVCFFNSFNFQPHELRFWHAGWKKQKPFVHRIDGPIKVYRGFDDGADQIVWEYNARYATRSILQSEFSLKKHQELGVDLIDPVLVMNASDPTIFYPPESRKSLEGRRAVIIATSWSDNPNKGLAVYQWLDEHLDFEKYRLLFAGRIQAEFNNIEKLGALESNQLADQLREADIYLTASRLDPCSNSLIEALTCGLPAVYLKSGGHPEIVGEAGLGFEKNEEIPALLEQVVSDYRNFQKAIHVNTIESAASSYLLAAGLDREKG